MSEACCKSLMATDFARNTTDIRHSYACYFSVVTIVRNHYRTNDESRELEARKDLTTALAQLASLES